MIFSGYPCLLLWQVKRSYCISHRISGQKLLGRLLQTTWIVFSSSGRLPDLMLQLKATVLSIGIPSFTTYFWPVFNPAIERMKPKANILSRVNQEMLARGSHSGSE